MEMARGNAKAIWLQITCLQDVFQDKCATKYLNGWADLMHQRGG